MFFIIQYQLILILDKDDNQLIITAEVTEAGLPIINASVVARVSLVNQEDDTDDETLLAEVTLLDNGAGKEFLFNKL